MQAAVGDKVRLKERKNRNARGVVELVDGGRLHVRLEGSESRLILPPEDVVNLSLAARKAWVSRPNRRVGRPKGLRLCDRVSVTLRLDTDVWKQFRDQEAKGIIGDRTATINRWLREKLAETELEEARGDAQPHDG